MTKLLIRAASAEDVKDIFNWRNDPLTRIMSHESKKICWESHKEWFTKSLNSKNCLLLISEDLNHNKISIIRFDISGNDAIVSINLNPAQRGKNLSKLCLTESIKVFKKKYLSIKKLIAEVNEKNFVSKKVFLEVGFSEYKLYDGIVFYRKSLI